MHDHRVKRPSRSAPRRSADGVHEEDIANGDGGSTADVARPSGRPPDADDDKLIVAFFWKPDAPGTIEIRWEFDGSSPLSNARRDRYQAALLECAMRLGGATRSAS